MRIVLLVALLGVCWAVRADEAADAALAAKIAALPAPVSSPVDFARDVQPIFSEKCASCHGGEKHKGGLKLDSVAAIKLGGDNGAALVAGKALESKLFQLVAGLDADSKMPPEGEPLNAAQLATLRAWIDQGAAMPEDAGELAPVKSDHWSFQPVQRPVPPTVADPSWIRTPIDAFVLARLEAEGVKQSPEAEKHVLLRRLHLDLTGLPPTLAEQDEFMNDPSPFAYEALVERLLASPHYGERWARHWLDLARYADSDGYEKDTPRPWAYRYRDWVIDAINSDIPYDQFVVKQVAGDLLPNATVDDLIATGFHRNTLTNKEGGVDQEEFRVAQVVDRTNTTAQIFMGLTMGCAQCHTHKYDPITQREYYQMYSFFNTGIERDVPAPKPSEVEAYQQAKAKFDAEMAAVDEKIALRAAQLKEALPEWEKTQDPADIAWVPLTPDYYRSASGPFLTLEKDGSLFASGAAYETEHYVVEYVSRMKDITGFLIEVLPDERLASGGPGRSSNGNFVLNTLSLSQSPLPEITPAENLAKFATASSPDDIDKDGGSTGDAGALDGTTDTFWDEEDHKARYVFQADFAEPRQVSAISLVGYEHHKFAPKTFDIVVDGQVAARIAEAVYENNFYVTEFPAVTGKTLQLVITGYYGNSPGIRELGIFDATPAAIHAGRVTSAPVELATAYADYEQPGYAAAGAIDKDGSSGWAVGGSAGGTAQRRYLRVTTKENVSTAAGVRLQFQLAQGYGQEHSIGRFRIYATTDPRARQELPDDLRAILRKPASRRTDEDLTRLAAYYGKFSDLPMQALLATRDTAMKAMPTPPKTMAQTIAPNPAPPETRILLRGDFLQKGDPVDGGTPAVLPALLKRGDQRGSSRLCQRWLTSPDHPLTVARGGEPHLGAALRRGHRAHTGRLGRRAAKSRPHPELLDWLASEYMAQGLEHKAAPARNLAFRHLPAVLAHARRHAGS
jgi:mono/diheme cytochrome c family protein